jgi:hypothetical protein
MLEVAAGRRSFGKGQGSKVFFQLLITNLFRQFTKVQADGSDAILRR